MQRNFFSLHCLESYQYHLGFPEMRDVEGGGYKAGGKETDTRGVSHFYRQIQLKTHSWITAGTTKPYIKSALAVCFFTESIASQQAKRYKFIVSILLNLQYVLNDCLIG